MRFWDTSALTPLILIESTSIQMRAFVRQDPLLLVWWGTHIEAVSALSRAHRNGRIDIQSLQIGLGQLNKLLRRATRVKPDTDIIKEAQHLLLTHDLRAADALQLSAAIVGRLSIPGLYFVSLDRRLREAAIREGFTVLPTSI